MKYSISSYNVIEKYNKDGKYLTFKICDKKNCYNYAIESKYKRKKKSIKKLSKNGTCIKTYLIDEKFTICKNKNKYVSNFYNNKPEKKYKKTINNIKYYDTQNFNYLIWNYNYFYFINNDVTKKIKIFDKDKYKLDIIGKVDNNLLIADYNQKYFFDNVFLIDSQTGEYKKIELNRKISFNSYILGYYIDHLYIYDFEKKQEYAINPYEKHVDKIKNKILVNDKFEEISEIKLMKGKYKFIQTNNFKFELKNNHLYYSYPNGSMLLSNIKVDKLIEFDSKVAFFVSGDTLYYININKGIKTVLKYSEWNFNNENIYVF